MTERIKEIKTIRVSVTARDIAGGCQGDSLACPIARAINRRLAGAFLAQVGRLTYRVLTDPDSLEVWKDALPERAVRLILNFDTGREAHPTWFELQLPEQLLKD